MTSVSRTKTAPDRTDRAWSINDTPIRFRVWGSERKYTIPASDGEHVVGRAPTCAVVIDDPERTLSNKHALLVRNGERISIRDLGSKNGTSIDGLNLGKSNETADAVHASERDLVPGAKLTLGGDRGIALLVESPRSIALRTFFSRVIGWTEDRIEEVDLALQSVRAATTGQATLVICAAVDADALSVAHSLHRLALGPDRPFVTCNQRRETEKESARTFRNFKHAVDALEHARGGSVCVWSSRLPADFERARVLAERPDARAQLLVCATKPRGRMRFLTRQITIPALSTRGDQIDHVIREYALDAIAELGFASDTITNADRALIRKRVSSLRDVEIATLRVAALRGAPNTNQAAALLGLTRWALEEWAKHWGLFHPPKVTTNRPTGR